MPSSSLDKARSAADSQLRDAESNLTALAKRAERAVQEGLDALRARSRTYADDARGYVDDARHYLDDAGRYAKDARGYVSDQVQERPVAITLAALGVGLIVGFLLAGRDR